MESQILILKTIIDSVKQFRESTNIEIRKNRVWLAQVQSPEKESVQKILPDINKYAGSFLSRYGIVNLEGLHSSNLTSLIPDIEEFYERIKEEIQALNRLINKPPPQADIQREKDLDTIGRFLDPASIVEEDISKYLPEIRNWNIDDIISKIEANRNPAGNSSGENADAPDNAPTGDVEKKGEPVNEDQVNMVLTKAQEFGDVLNRFTKENYDWYTDVKGEKDAELGDRIRQALDCAREIINNGSKYLSPDEKKAENSQLFIGHLSNFYISIGEIISQCRFLHDYYPTVLSGAELQTSIGGFQELETLIQPFFSNIEQIALAFSIGRYTIAIVPKENINSSFSFNEETFAVIKSDVPNADAVDSLDITPDVNALASVITYKAVTPPLAIGLFGNWGSGKSFFMKKLRKQIDVFADDEGDNYVNRVVHIEFNSWHYSDSNLWASFVTKIFEDLDNYGKKHPNAVKELFKKLNESSEFLTEANTKLQGITLTITALEKELEQKKTDISEKAQKLTGIKLTDIAVKVLSNTNVQEKLDDVKKQLPQRELNNLSDIYRSIKELDGFINKFIETIKLLLSFKSWKSWVALLLFIIICTSPFWLFAFFHKHITDGFNWFGKYSTPAAIILANLAGIASYATVGLNKVQEKLKSIAGDCAVLEKEALAQHQFKVDKIQGELDVQKQAQIQKEAEINSLKKEQAEIQVAINDIQSGKKLASFIAGRVTDQRYTNSLGLISWIRKDFQKLDELLKEQREVNKLNEKSKEEKEKIFQVDRIVLYIDDLDRCNEKVVVKVLEAIHLLLAFELFVVVVGVDPRWMHNALQNKYNSQLKKLNGKKTDANEDKSNADIDSATSYDYLEKIFQVPFSLNEINPQGKWNLIDDQLKVKEQNPVVEVGKKTLTDDKKTVTLKKEKEDTGNTRDLPPQTDPEIETAELRENKKLENEQEIKRAKKALVISPDEIKFMKAVSELIGYSPRAVNRYINIYRIIRSHRNLKKTDTPIQDYCAVMVLLGIITGFPNESEDFFKSLAQEQSGTFESLINKQNDEFKSLKDACKIPFKISESSDRTVGELSIEFMKQKFELVQRFSFHSYSENEFLSSVSQNENRTLQRGSPA